ncbi:hypothetical protein CRUP_013184, partial [Coryphaenoides rupestris]
TTRDVFAFNVPTMQVRTRPVAVFSQWRGTPCAGEASQVVPCASPAFCPLQTGCGERFRCTSGQCIGRSLVCNGDHDCEDGLDERACDGGSGFEVCDLDKTPPNSDVTGRGYDVLTGKLRGGVINTLSFGGQCNKVSGGDHGILYRLPQSILRVNNEESDESYDSSWSYMLHVKDDAMFGHNRRTFHQELSDSKAKRLLVLKNTVELAQFQNSAPQYLTLSEGFWRALSSLPLVYDYPAYRTLLQAYGTHYMSEGTLGGQYQALLEFNQQSLASSRHNSNVVHIHTNVVGGTGAFIGELGWLDLENPEANAASYARWASSVKDFPDVINQKLRPVYELVKEVHCAGLRRLYLRRATEQYLAEEHPCHCRPCRNNGRTLLSAGTCVCVCRPGTAGLACQEGGAIGEPAVPALGVRGHGPAIVTTPPPAEGGLTALYGCITGHYPVGQMEALCTDGRTWRTGAMRCRKVACDPPPLPGDVIATPARATYGIGDRVSLSCPQGRTLEAPEPVITCTPGLRWSPLEAEAVRCAPAAQPPTPRLDLHCQLWETQRRAECVCRMPFECPPSLPACGRLASSNRTRVLSVCQLGALRCLGRGFSLADGAECVWPAGAATPSCPACTPGQTCQEGQCRCQSPAECPEDSSHLCVRHGGSAVAVAMTQCEAPSWRNSTWSWAHFSAVRKQALVSLVRFLATSFMQTVGSGSRRGQSRACLHRHVLPLGEAGDGRVQAAGLRVDAVGRHASSELDPVQERGVLDAPARFDEDQGVAVATVQADTGTVTFRFTLRAHTSSWYDLQDNGQ